VSNPSPTPVRRRYLPVAPLVAVVERTGSIHGLFDEAQERALHRAKRAGRLTREQADELAVALGRHPSEIWEWAAPRG
jgi:hypothetical protein